MDYYTDYTILEIFLCSNIHPGFGASSSTWTKAFGLLKARWGWKGWVDFDGRLDMDRGEMVVKTS